jgi:chromosomal replication initiator protein DnaA
LQPIDSNESQIWSLVLRSLKSENLSEVIEAWYNRLKLISVDEKSAILLAPSKLIQGIITKRCSESLDKHFELVLGSKIEVMITAADSEAEYNEILRSAGFEPETAPIEEEEIVPSTESPATAAVAVATADDASPDEEEPAIITTNNDIVSNRIYKPGSIGVEYTFDNFIVGGSNRFAYAACTNVASKLDGQYNPLFIYGQSGLGKTHLMCATINEIRSRHPDMNIIYIKGEDFTNQLIDAIAKGTTAAFKERYRKADVLLIDDIQFIAGKNSTQEEFFHTFNALYEDNRQIILTSDRPPKEMVTLEERIRSRFESGLPVDITPPDFELRFAILKKIAESKNLPIPNEVLTFLAEKIRSNIRQLEGVIKKLHAMYHFEGMPITLEVVMTSIPEYIKENEPIESTIDRIITTVAKKYGITKTDIMSSKRAKEIATARHITIYITRTITDLSLPSLGKVFSRDHSTILSSCNVIESKITTDQKLKSEVADLIRELKG